MSLEKTAGYVEAVQALEANTSPRAKHLAHLERYVDGTQYQGLPDWFSDTKPLMERAPCIVYPAARNAILSNKDLLLGEGRYPAFVAEGLEGDESEAFEAAIAKLMKQARLSAAAREVFVAGQGTGSACAIFGIRGGRLFIEATRARWCEPELDAEGAVTKLTIQYAYLVTEKNGGTLTTKAKLYRRVIDDKSDTTYLSADARVDGVQPEWKPDPKRTIEHGLGFCPVIWYAHEKGCSPYGEVDGHAIHENLTDEIRAHDFALSQRHRAALYSGDPQWTETGVSPDDGPVANGRKAEVPASLTGAPGEKPHAAYVSAPRGKVRKKGPGKIWSYESDKVQVKLHTLPGEALEAIDKNARDLRIKLSESMGVVLLDPENLPISTSLSGRALEALKSRQLDRVDDYRVDFGDFFLLPAIGMLMRIATVKQLAVQGLEVVQKVISAAGTLWSWRMPPLGLVWGRYFRLDADEEAKTVDFVAKAKDAGLATKRVCAEKLRPIFGIKDVDEYLDELEAEADEAMERQQQIAADMMMGGAGGDEEDESGTGARPPGRRRARKARTKDKPSAAEDGA